MPSQSSLSTTKNSRDEVRNLNGETIRSRATWRFSGHWAALVGKRLGRGVYAREERSKRRINSPRFGRLKKYAGNCERSAAGRWLARDGSRRQESSRKLVRTLVSGYCAFYRFWLVRKKM